MATTTLLSLSDYTSLYSRSASAPDAVVTARLLDMSAAVLRYIGWPLNAAGDLTLASTSHVLTIPEEYPLQDDGRVTLPLAWVTAVSEVRAGEDVGGTAGVDYEVLTSGTDYRVQLADPLRPVLRWLGGSRGPELRVACTAGVTAPEDLRNAVGQLVAWSLTLDLHRSRSSVSDAQMATTSYRPEEWPADVLALLRPLALPHVRAVRA
jgi:hypothetical protein